MPVMANAIIGGEGGGGVQGRWEMGRGELIKGMAYVRPISR